MEHLYVVLSALKQITTLLLPTFCLNQIPLRMKPFTKIELEYLTNVSAQYTVIYLIIASSLWRPEFVLLFS